MKILLILIAIIASNSIIAQTRLSNVDQGRDIDQIIEIDDTEYKLFNTDKGDLYIKLRNTFTGKLYPFVIDRPLDSVYYEGRQVYQTSKGTYCIYIKDSITKNPNKVIILLK